MSAIEQVEGTIAELLECEDPFADVMSVIIVERWDARNGRHSAHVHMTLDDIQDTQTWLDYNAPKYTKLKNIVEDMQEIFPGIPYKYMIESLFRFF